MYTCHACGKELRVDEAQQLILTHKMPYYRAIKDNKFKLKDLNEYSVDKYYLDYHRFQVPAMNEFYYCDKCVESTIEGIIQYLEQK